MNGCVGNNRREPLGDGVKLTDKLTIDSLLSDCGGTSLVYIAKDSYNHKYIVKETYPIRSSVPIYRLGFRLVIDDQPGKQEEIEKLRSNHKEECERADVLFTSENGSNSIFHFATRDITDEVTAGGDFRGTVAQYMLISTVEGRTLKEIKDEDEISLRQALVYTKKILESIRVMHSEPKQMLHLDIKPENLYFPSELKETETFAIVLDCGSAQPIGRISESTRFSISDNYAAREVQLLKKYMSAPNTAMRMAAEKYREFIGPSTDIYTIGAIAFQLIMGNDFLHHNWKNINEEDDPNEKKEMIIEEMRRCVGAEYPGLYERIGTMLSKAMYFSPKKELVAQNRYVSCEEFIREVEVIIDILDDKGIHPEIVLKRSMENFEKILSNTSIKYIGDPVENDNLFVKDWFPSVENTQY